MEVVNRLEHDYPVEEWVIDGIHAWPFLRINLNFDLYRAYHSPAVSSGTPLVGRYAASGIGLLRNMARYAYSALSDSGKNGTIGTKAGAVFLSDGVSFVELDGYWFDKYCDPLIRLVREKEQAGSVLLAIQHEYLVPRFSESVFVQPRLDLYKIRSKLVRGRVPAMRMPEYECAVAAINGSGLPARLPGARQLAAQVSTLRSVSGWFKRILERTSPDVAFVVSYYGLEGMAFNVACRELGIPSVDLQHGLQGDLHAAYGRWHKVPSTGYEMLPSIFWCWSESERETIERWSSPVSSWHRAFVGGNLWLKQWLDPTNDLVGAYDRRIRSVTETTPGAKRVLVTLQSGLAGEETLAPLLEAMGASEPDWRWWIRLHPCMLRERQRIRDMLKAHGITGFELDMPSDLPLYAVLRHVDVHVTHSSSTVVEAGILGVPSVVFSEYGAEFFPSLMASSRVRAAFSGAGIVSAIREQAGAAGNLAWPLPRCYDMPNSEVFDLLVEMTSRYTTEGFRDTDRR